MFLLGTIQTICFGLEPTIYAEPCVRDKHHKFLKSFNIMSNSWFNEWVKELFKENEFSGLIPKSNQFFDREIQYLLPQMVDPPSTSLLCNLRNVQFIFLGGGEGSYVLPCLQLCSVVTHCLILFLCK